ncbi:MAG: recombinase family protein [Actinomycetota bacterium]
MTKTARKTARGKKRPATQGGILPASRVRVAVYTRISTDEDHQPFSLEAQQDRLDSYVKSQDNWKVVRRYEDQMTGSIVERPGLQDALRDARARRFDLLLVVRVDRLARSVRALASILEDLDAHGIAFRSATEPFDTASPAGRMMVQMLGVFAEFERATIIERVVAGMEKKAAKGGWNGGKRPHGYDYDPNTGALRVNDEEAPLVQEIFDLYTNQQIGSAAIARLLDERGHRTKNGARWSGNAIRVVLSNSAYVGKVFFRGELYPGQHPALISIDQFERAHQILDERGEEPAKRRSNMSEFLFSGLLVCAKCEKHFVGTTANGNGGIYRYYTCYSRQRYGPNACDQERLPADQLEVTLIQHIVRNLRDNSVLDAAIDKALATDEGKAPSYEREMSALEAETRDVHKRIDRYLQAFESGAIDPDACGARLSELKDRQDALESRRIELVAQAESGQAPLRAEDAKQVATAFADRLEEKEIPRVKKVLQTLVNKILVESRSAIQPFISLPLVRIMGGWVGAAGLEPAATRL